MHALTGNVRAYPWGSRTLLAGLRGEEASENKEAELWYGAHPQSPSYLGDVPLTEALTSADVGERVNEAFGPQLPFLLKILAADEPLSLQAHPTAEQARAGYEAENAAGIPTTAPNRNYKDPNHKPELIVALTEFSALAGFRPLDRTHALFRALNCPQLDRYLTVIDNNPAHEDANLRALFTTWITIPAAARGPLIDAVIDCARTVVAAATAPAWILDALSNVIDLAERYPGDIGVLGALLLNKVNLAPGQALYLSAGQLHAYMHGMGVEIMANSDNVLRGGLTSKYVDVPELVKVLDFHSLAQPHVEAVTQGNATHYPCPAEEYDLTKYDFDADTTVTLNHDGPMVLLCTAGTLHARTTDDSHTFTPTQAVWVPATEPTLTITGTPGAQLFVATA